MGFRMWSARAFFRPVLVQRVDQDRVPAARRAVSFLNPRPIGPLPQGFRRRASVSGFLLQGFCCRAIAPGHTNGTVAGLRVTAKLHSSSGFAWAQASGTAQALVGPVGESRTKEP